MRYSGIGKLLVCGLLLVTRNVSAQEFWKPTTGPAGSMINALVINAKGDLFVGTYGAGLFRSTDNGNSWKLLNTGLTNPIVLGLAIHSSGALFTATEGGEGIFRSTDNGESWTAVNGVPSNFGTISMAFDSSGNLFVSTANGGVFRSTDRGDSWMAPTGNWQGYFFRSLTVNSSGYIFAGGSFGVYRSTDKGVTWTAANAGIAGISILALNADAKGQVFAGGSGGMFRSTDNGGTWTALAASYGPLQVFALAVNPSGDLFAGTFDAGIIRSTDGGVSWKTANAGLTDTKIISLAPSRTGRMYAGTRGGLVFASTDNGGTWIGTGPMVTNDYVRTVGTASPNYIFAGTHYQRGFFRSSDNGDTWANVDPGININNFAVSRAGTILAGGDGGVYRSTNSGITWTVSSVATSASILALAVDSSGYIVASSSGGEMYRSTDDGVSWLTVNGGVKISDIFSIVMSPNGHAFAASCGKGVLRSTDKGSSWNMVGGVWTDPWVWALVPNSSGHLFVAANSGVLRSTDDGDSWINTSYGLPNREVFGLAINSVGELFAAVQTYGVFRSTDNGESWSAVSAGLACLYMQMHCLAVSSSDFVVFGSVNGAYRSARSTTAPFVGENVSDPRTVLLLHMNETLGSAITDASNFGNKATANATVLTNGRFGRAKRFNLGGSLSVPHSTSLNIGASDFTLEAWVNTQTPDNVWTVMSKWDGRKGFSWDIQNNGIPTFTVTNDAGTTRKLTGKRYIDNLKWHHVAIRRQGTQISQYIDGALDISMDVAGAVEDFSSTAAIVMGSGLGNVQNFSLDEVRISNVARSLQEFGLQLPPKNVSASLSGSAVNLSWTNGGGAVGAMRFKIYRGVDSTLVILKDSTTTLTYTDLGLAASTQYFYAVSAVDSTGFESGKSNIASVITQAASGPAVATLSASSAAGATATLNGSVNPNGLSTTAWFEWGTSATFATFNQTPAQSVGSGSSATTFSTDLSGLSQNTTYYFRTVAQNAGGIQKGGIANFTTTKAPAGSGLKAMHFAGPEDYVEIPHSDSLTPAKMTIETWVFIDSISGRSSTAQGVVDKRDYRTSGGGGYQLRLPDQFAPLDITAALPFGPNGGSESDIVVARAINPNRWCHIAMTYDGTVSSIFVNGILVASQPCTLAVPMNSTIPLRLGGSPFIPNQAMHGYLDEVRIWNYPRSQSQLKDNMNKLLFGDEPGLVGYWTFDEDAGTIVKDRSRTADDGQRFGNAQEIDSDLSFAPSLKLTSPSNGAATIPVLTTLSWNATASVSRYRLDISKSSFFTSYVLQDSSIAAKSRQVGPLQDSTTYYWRVIATAYSGEEVKSDVWSFTTVPTYKSTMAVNTTLGFTSKAKASDYAATDYKLFGLPGASDLVLNSIFSGTQNVDWQVYWDNGASSNFLIPYDGSSNFKFSTGRAFWFISMRPISVDRTVSAASLNSDQEVFVPLHSGWNIVTNPFTSPIQWSKIQSVNGITALIYGFDGAFSPATSFDPYVGYYLFNGSPNPTLSGLRVPYNSIFTKMDQTATSGSKGWRLGVSVTTGAEVIKGVEIGVEPDARTGLDAHDERVPRGVGKTAEVVLQREEWDKDYPSFMSDIRPAVIGAEKWKITVRRSQKANANGQKCVVHVGGVANVPAQYDVYLVDTESRRSVDLRKQSSYDYDPPEDESGFMIVVGDRILIRDDLSSILPTKIEVGPNYPNPFNPETVIPITLTEGMRVTVKIYDILGREVRMLHDGWMEQGTTRVRWDGKNGQASPVSSGVFLYRVIIGNKLKFQGKMIVSR